jgi:hypothetical protein
VCLTPDAQATGNVGRPIVDAFVAASFTVTVGTRHIREDADSKFPPSIFVKTVNIENVSSLATAFAGQDAIVEAFNPTAARFQINALRQRCRVESSISSRLTLVVIHSMLMRQS